MGRDEMKLLIWLKKYLSAGPAFLSVFVGGLAFLLSARFAGWRLALIYSLLMAAGLMLVLPFVLWIEDRKYRDVRERMGAAARFVLNANISVGGRPRNGYLILMDDALFVFCRDKRPRLEWKVDRDDAVRVTLEDAVHLRVGESNTQTGFVVIASACGALFNHMREAGWNCPSG